LRGREQGLEFDPELLYVGAMFHGIDADAAQRVWTGIALHTTPESPLHMAPEIALVTRDVELDVLGSGYHTITESQRAAIRSGSGAQWARR
jgi:hypothetical protein